MRHITLCQSIRSSLEAERAVVLATIVSRRGLGTRTRAAMAIFEDGGSNGTIGGGKFEADVREGAADIFETRESRNQAFGKTTVHYAYFGEEFLLPLFRKAEKLEKRHLPFVIATLGGGNHAVALYRPGLFLYQAPSGEVPEAAMRSACEHAYREEATADGIYANLIGEPYHVVLVGGGNVNEAVSKLCGLLGYSYEVVETRRAFATKTLYPDATKIQVVGRFIDAVPGCTLDAHTAVIISSHQAADEGVVEEIRKTKAAYIGVLGSRSRPNPWKDSRIFFPVGLDLGGESPAAVALCITSEMSRVLHKSSGRSLSHSRLVIVRGAGDLATGTIIRLHNAGYQVLALEVPEPTVIRRTVSFAEALFQGSQTVMGIEARKINSIDEVFPTIDKGIIPVLADPEGNAIKVLQPMAVVDAIIAKKNLGTNISDAPLVVALGPGFTAGVDCHVVIETKRGHYLGSLIRQGSAAPNSGIPGIIAGFGKERVIHSSTAGVFRHAGFEIGDIVQAGDTIAYVDDVPQKTGIGGMLRGLLREGLVVPAGFKCADVDPRGKEACYTLPSDKAMAIAGGVLEAVDAFAKTW